MTRIIIIGGLSAGPSAAAKARREDENAEIILFEKTANVSYATCGIPYALSGVIESRDKLLVVEADQLRARFQIDVHLQEEVLDVDVQNQVIITNIGEYEYDKLVFATGARAIVPPIENIDKVVNWSTCRTLKDFDKIMLLGMLENTKHITVLGGGLIGVEVAENLIKSGKKVTLVEGATHVLPIWEPGFSILAENVLKNENLEIVTGKIVTKLIHDQGTLTSIELSDGSLIDTDFVVVSVGIKPNTDLLVKHGAEVIGNGALVVDSKMMTSLPNIYAAGDNASTKNLETGENGYFPLGTHSNKGGRAAGANSAGVETQFGGAQGTAIIKLFDYAMGRTGLSTSDLKRLGRKYKSNLIVASSTPGYYPNPKDMVVEVYYDSETNELLGGQVFGQEGVDKRVDVLATAIYAKLKVTDLPQLDLAYAPPFSPAKDPVVVAGFVAENSSLKGYQEISAKELIDQSNVQIVDVRELEEQKVEGTIQGSLSIPLDDLRDRINELDATMDTVVYCARGLRGYIAWLILTHHGFRVKNLAGGYRVWQGMGMEIKDLISQKSEVLP